MTNEVYFQVTPRDADNEAVKALLAKPPLTLYERVTLVNALATQIRSIVDNIVNGRFNSATEELDLVEFRVGNLRDWMNLWCMMKLNKCEDYYTDIDIVLKEYWGEYPTLMIAISSGTNKLLDEVNELAVQMGYTKFDKECLAARINYHRGDDPLKDLDNVRGGRGR